MRKLKGITINGEWLGDNVIINGLFRNICEISPLVMKEFIKIINSIDKLDEAVRINNFNFPDNNTIEIEFSNKSVSGLADLYFYLDNGVPKLSDSKLTFKNSAEACTNNKQEVVESLEDNTINNELAEAEKKSININNNEEKPAEPVLTEELEPKIQEEIIIEKNEQEIVEKTNPAEGSEEDIVELYNINGTIQETSTADNQEVSTPEKQTVSEEKAGEAEKNSISQDAISAMVDEIIAKSPNFAGLSQPVQIQLMQPIAEPQPVQIQPIIIQEQNENNTKPESIVEERVCEKPEIENIKEESAKEEDFQDKESDIAQNESEEVVIEDSTDIEEDENKEICEISDDAEDIEEESPILEEIESEESDIEENISDDIIDCDSDTEEEFEEIDEESDIEDSNIEDIESSEETKEDIQEESEDDIEDCLSDFYNVDKNAEIINEAVTGQVKNNIAMHAMLSEMVILKDELKKLKSEQPKPTVSEFFGDNEIQDYNIEDEDADFKIMANGARINASILDEDLFIAGNRLYRWGDTLYLDE